MSGSLSGAACGWMHGIERAGEADLGDLSELSGRLHAFEGIESTASGRAAVLLPLLRDDARGGILVKREGGELAGYVAVCLGYSIELGGMSAFVDELFVGEQWRGRGIGAGLLSAAISFAEGLGVGVLLMEVARDNALAADFYARRGFRPRDKYRLLTRPLRGSPVE